MNLLSRSRPAKHMSKQASLALAFCLLAPLACADEFDPALESRVREISTDLRCLVCQNQTIADSEAPLAVDLRREVRNMLRQGNDPAQIRQFMVERYGDFVLYQPPMKPHTWFLWFGPAIFVFGGGWILARHLRARDPATDEEASS